MVVGQYALTVSTSDTAGTRGRPGRFEPRGATSPPTRPSTPRRRRRPTASSAAGPPRARTATPRPARWPTWRRSAPGTHLAAGLSTSTTVGNNANTHEAWAEPARPPAALFQAPVSPDPRLHAPTFTDAWNNSRCNPAELRPGRQRHRRVGDQPLRRPQPDARLQPTTSASPRTTTTCRPTTAAVAASRGDAEIGNAQAGAITGANYTTGLGRDNANQIALQDGVPGITNQYLFQPIAGAFYAPCTDGGLDMGIVGHEYTHAISNRMVGGPDEGLTVRAGRRDGRVVGRPGRRRVPVQPRLRQRRQRVGRRRLRHRQPRHRDPRLRHRPQPAQLLRLRLRHHRPRGARRRRDLERHDVGGPPGPRRCVRRVVRLRRRGAAAAVRAGHPDREPHRRRGHARATGAGSS